MRVSVIGCGYLGAVHAASMSMLGHEVTGVDVDAAKVEALSRREAPFFEPGLDEMLRDIMPSGRLNFTTDVAEAADVHRGRGPATMIGPHALFGYVRARLFEARPPHGLGSAPCPP